MRWTAWIAALVLAGCSRYDDFRLPAPPGSGNVRFAWQVHPEPVLDRGPEAWDAVDVLNPSVVRVGGEFWNLYSGFDGTSWHTGLAVGPDPLHWTKRGRILSAAGGYIAANGTALAGANGVVRYWYQSGNPPRISLAQSPDWKPSPGAVVDAGPLNSWDERGIGDPDVIEAGGTLYLYYTGMDRAGRQRLGVARSNDGVQWTKLRANPLLELGGDGAFDENGLGEPAVWASHGHYWMLYTGRDRHENRKTGLAESSDGVTWKRSARAALLSPNEAWNDRVVCDPAVVPAEGGVHVWFGGGNVARPDERINGKIGYAFLREIR